MMRVLAVGAHPDDIEILCAGTLAKFAALGHQVVMAYATNGNMGHMFIPPDELAEIRRKEATNSAAVIGAEMIWMNIDDQLIVDDLPTRMKFIEMVRQARPDLVITHSPNDYIMDHRRTGSLVFEATFMAGLPNLKTQSPAHPGVSPLYYMDSLAGIGFLPTEWVDISDHFDAKIKMLSQHQSQVKWLKDHDNIDIIEFVTTAARYRGIQVGTQYAEGFVRVNQWPRASAQRLLP